MSNRIYAVCRRKVVNTILRFMFIIYGFKLILPPNRFLNEIALQEELNPLLYFCTFGCSGSSLWLSLVNLRYLLTSTCNFW